MMNADGLSPALLAQHSASTARHLPPPGFHAHIDEDCRAPLIVATPILSPTIYTAMMKLGLLLG